MKSQLLDAISTPELAVPPMIETSFVAQTAWLPNLSESAKPQRMITLIVKSSKSPLPAVARRRFRARNNKFPIAQRLSPKEGPRNPE
jgi:hypothetical protein